MLALRGESLRGIVRVIIQWQSVSPSSTRLLPCQGCMRRLLSSHSGRSRPLVSVKGWWVRLVDERSLTLSSCLEKNTGDDPTSSHAPKVCTPVSDESSQSSSAGTSVDDIKDAVAEETAAKSKMETIVTVRPTLKKKKKIDFRQSYYDNIYITPVRAMDEYLLGIHDLEGLVTTTRRSAYPDADAITVYLRRDVELVALQVWGSLETLTKERQKRIERDRKQHALDLFYVKRAKKEYLKQHAGPGKKMEEKPYLFSPPAPPVSENIFDHGSGKVVLYALLVNGANMVLKFGAWIYTGSHSMFSEFIHSSADTANQLLLAVGLHQSLKKPDPEHPYGWASFRNVSSLISGVSIFCVGAGLSVYHGITGLINPGEVTSLYWGISILLGSLVSEGSTLMVAANQVRVSAKADNMSVFRYILHGNDPSTTVVLLEDMAAVLGVICAATCMSITYYTGSPTADAIGSLLIGSLLGGVSSFIIYTNTIALVGRSIPKNKKLVLMRELESDRMIRTLHDVKATEMGTSFVRFKAEVDFDGRELTRYYLENHDLDKMLEEMYAMRNIEDVEAFMLKHGEAIVDTLGSEVDRIEQNLKKKHPEIRHVDLEQL
ncbi:hypothetical protein NP493_673g00011 [Ridgeia piscesae]|uniref:Proton-coupled zinc antiporter SLC30A9, mitochondrial n=1 Tax=Ridgeia piscesae TaxID=27915 RepID=A0AAD9KS27_RIDPI|nr:hypothetical protein NP493_673g00011 [Ridgeia piscesae]